MRLSTAVLCDFAQIRDGLLFVSSGAVSRLYRKALPSPLGVMVGVVIEIPIEDSSADHELVAQVINRQGEELTVIRNAFRVGVRNLFPHEVQQAPMVLSITGVEAVSWGTHQVRLYLDDSLECSLTFYVVPTTVGSVSLVAPNGTQGDVAEPPSEPDIDLRDDAPVSDEGVEGSEAIHDTDTPDETTTTAGPRAPITSASALRLRARRAWLKPD